MLALPGLRYLIAAEVLILICTSICWWRVWASPTPDRMKVAAFWTSALVAFRAIALSLGVMATMP